MTTKRYVLSGYAAWVALLIVVYYAVSGLRVEAWGLISLSAVTAILAGVLFNRPARKVPWLLLAAALACFAAGQLSFLIAAKLRVVLPFPSFADVLYLSTFPLIAAGLLIFVYWRTPDGDRRSLIDALTLTVGLALLSWAFLIRPVCARLDAVRAAEKRRDRLPARRRAPARPAGAAARARVRADQVRPAPHPGRRRVPGVRRGLRGDAVARVVPQRFTRRPRLGTVLLRLGRRGAAPEHDAADRAGAEAAGGGLAGQAGPAHARLAHRASRAAHRRAGGPRRPT